MSDVSLTTASALAEIYHGEWAAAERRFMRGAPPWEDLKATERSAIESGVVAVAAHLVNPTAEDFDRAADEIAGRRYALVEQMGYRSVTGTVRETEFVGRKMLEVTDLRDGTVRLVGGESLYQVTWLTREQAERNVTPPKAIGWGYTDAEMDERAEAGEDWNAPDRERDDDDGDAEETAAILADPGTMAAIAEGEAELRASAGTGELT